MVRRPAGREQSAGCGSHSGALLGLPQSGRARSQVFQLLQCVDNRQSAVPWAVSARRRTNRQLYPRIARPQSGPPMESSLSTGSGSGRAACQRLGSRRGAGIGAGQRRSFQPYAWFHHAGTFPPRWRSQSPRDSHFPATSRLEPLAAASPSSRCMGRGFFFDRSRQPAGRVSSRNRFRPATSPLTLTSGPERSEGFSHASFRVARPSGLPT